MEKSISLFFTLCLIRHPYFIRFYSILTKKSFKITGREWIQILFPVLALVLLQHIGGGFILTRFEVDIKYSLYTRCYHLTLMNL